MPLPKWFDPRSIGRRLHQARGELSQRAIGQSLGYLQPHVSRYEAGEIPGSYRYLAGLAALHGVDLNWVLTGKPAALLSDATSVEPIPLDRLDRSSLSVGTERRAASEPAFERSSEGLLVDALRGFVLDLVGQSPRTAELTPASSRGHLAQPAEAHLAPSPLLHSWDRVLVELPLLLSPLVGTLAQAAALGATQDGDATEDGGAKARGIRPAAELLDAVAKAAKKENIKEAVEILMESAAALERGASSVLSIERARFLLLWASLLAESGVARSSESAALAARALFRLARATRKSGRLEEAEGIYREALSRAARAGEAEIVARCHAGLGNLYFERGQFEPARGEYVALLEEALRLGDPRLLFRAYLDLAAYYHEGERAYEKAAEYASTGLEIARREGDLEHVGRFLNELALNDLERGELKAAEGRFREVLELGASVGSALLSVIARINLGDLQLRAGAHEAAVESLQAARAIAAQAGMPWAECQAEILLARADHALGRAAPALERLERIEEQCAARGLSHERDLARRLTREIQFSVLGKLEAAAS